MSKHLISLVLLGCLIAGSFLFSGCVKAPTTASNQADNGAVAAAAGLDASGKSAARKKSVVFLTDVSRSMKDHIGSMTDWLRAEPVRSFGLGDTYRSVLLKGRSFDDRVAITLSAPLSGRIAQDRRGLTAGVQVWQKNVDTIRSLQIDDNTDVWGALCKGASILELDREQYGADRYLVVMSDLKDNRRERVNADYCRLNEINVLAIFVAHDNDKVNDYTSRVEAFTKRVNKLGAQSARVLDVAQTRAATQLLPVGYRR